MNNNRNFSFPESSAEVLDRVMDAYGFTTKIQIAEHYDMAASSLSARYKRNIFPADMVVQCSIETGANIEWLTFGTGSKFASEKLDILKVSKFVLVEGKIAPAGYYLLDKVSFGQSSIPGAPVCIVDGLTSYIIDKQFHAVTDGEWLIQIDGEYSLRTLTRMPMQKVRVSGSGMAFDCDLSDLEISGRVVVSISVN